MSEPDHLLKPNAAKLANRIESYWQKRGYKVDLTLEPVDWGQDLWAVRSNMVDGVPPREPRASA